MGLKLDKLSSNIWRLNRMDLVMQRQKSRMLWFKVGDKNTNFFHRMANARRRINYIIKIREGGRSIEKLVNVKEGIATFF